MIFLIADDLKHPKWYDDSDSATWYHFYTGSLIKTLDRVFIINPPKLQVFWAHGVLLEDLEMKGDYYNRHNWRRR